MTALWVVEHGAGYDVPDVITKAEGIRDLSWHNDTCPCFGVDVEIDRVHDDGATSDGVYVRIWVEHPDPDQRESAGDLRYAVTGTAWDPLGFELLAVAGVPNGEDLDGLNAQFVTDDPTIALATFFRYIALLHAAVAAEKAAA